MSTKRQRRTTTK